MGWLGSAAGAQDNPNALPVTVKVNVSTPTVQDAKNPKAPKGATSVSKIGSSFAMDGTTPTMTINVDVNIEINPAAVGKDYTITEKGPCQGMTFKMTKAFIQAHEQKHVDQIQNEVQKAVKAGVTYNANAKTLKVTAGGSAAGSPNDKQILDKVTSLAQSTVTSLSDQDKAEYDSKAFPPGSLEGEARAAACETLMQVRNQLKQTIDQAKQALDDAVKDLQKSDAAATAAKVQAAAAAKAADAALKAALACDLTAFQAAVKQYEAAKKNADDKIKEATDLHDKISAAIQAIEAALVNYENLKTSTPGIQISKFGPGDEIRDTIRKGLDGTKAVPGVKSTLETQKKTVQDAQKTLDKAAETMKAAYDALKKCAEAKNKDNKQWQQFIEDHKTELGTTPGDSSTPPPEPPKAGGTAPETPNQLKSGIANPVDSNASVLDFGQARQWPGAAKPLPRENSTQLMMIDLLDIEIPGLRVARDEVPSLRGAFAQIWSALTRGRPSFLATVVPDRPSIWLDPLRGAPRSGAQGVTRATRVHAYLSSLGNSTGEAFDIQIVNDGSEPVRLGGDGVVVQPVKSGTDKAMRTELQQIASRSTGKVSARANAYCLEFKLKPPASGNLFEVSDEATQQKYAPAREILRASRRLQAAGELMADSDPRDYYHAIRQWAIWTHEQRFTMEGYRAAFIDRTRKNVEALGRKWSKDLETALIAYVPHRWDDITKILREAGQTAPAR